MPQNSYRNVRASHQAGAIMAVPLSWLHDRKIVAISIGFIHSKFAIRLFKIIRFFLEGKKNRKNILKNKWNHKFMLALVLGWWIEKQIFLQFHQIFDENIENWKRCACFTSDLMVGICNHWLCWNFVSLVKWSNNFN